jgi:hypothetical protein
MAILALGSVAPTVGAGPIGYFSNGSRLHLIDLATGEATEIGPFGPSLGVSIIAFAPDGTLYGVGQALSGGPQLVAIDPATGVAELVTELTLNDPFNSFEWMTADACGRLYVGGSMGVFGGGLRQKVVEIDPVTGSLEEIVSMVVGGPSGLAARGETLLTVVNGMLTTIDPSTGEITPVAGESVPGLDYDFAADGFLWGAAGGGPSPVPVPGPGPPVHTYRLDPLTGEWAQVAEHQQSILGIAIALPPGACGTTLPLAIPAVSPLGLAGLAILLAAGGAILARRAG